MADLDELDRLHAAATPGPWRVGRGVIVNDAEYGSLCISNIAKRVDVLDDLEAIAALMNAWPEISRELRALRASQP